MGSPVNTRELAKMNVNKDYAIKVGNGRRHTVHIIIHTRKD